MAPGSTPPPSSGRGSARAGLARIETPERETESVGEAAERPMKIGGEFVPPSTGSRVTDTDASPKINPLLGDFETLVDEVRSEQDAQGSDLPVLLRGGLDVYGGVETSDRASAAKLGRLRELREQLSELETKLDQAPYDSAGALFYSPGGGPGNFERNQISGKISAVKAEIRTLKKQIPSWLPEAERSAARSDVMAPAFPVDGSSGVVIRAFPADGASYSAEGRWISAKFQGSTLRAEGEVVVTLEIDRKSNSFALDVNTAQSMGLFPYDGRTSLPAREAPRKNIAVMMKSAHEVQEAEFSAIKDELAAYGDKNGLRGLEDRTIHGLDPSGMLAVSGTRAKIERIAEKLGASMSDVEALTNELHVGNVWKNAGKLAEAKDPAVQVWLIAAHITQEGEKSPAEFLQDVERVNDQLLLASQDPKAYAEKARQAQVVQAANAFTVEDGVPYSVQDAFLQMAIQGHVSGVVRADSGIFFVASDTLDFSVLKNLGLTQDSETLARGTQFRDAEGKPVVKFLNKGFAIVFDADRPESLETAKMLARTGRIAKE